VNTHFEMTIVGTTKMLKNKLESVLLIDDNKIDNFINRKVLEDQGVKNIITHTNTIDALNYLKETTDIPQIILLEMYLPIMDGLGFLNKFWKSEFARKPTNIFILSCSINPADLEMTKQKCSGFIEKPLTTEKLFAKLNMAKIKEANIISYKMQYCHDP
jgi:response regulator RpfG family c-di-GMP phosphodiesterase